MKFAVAVLLGLVSAIDLTRHHHHLAQHNGPHGPPGGGSGNGTQSGGSGNGPPSGGRGGGGPTPGDIIMMCDTDASGGLTKDEANTCIDQMITDPQANQDAHDQVNNGFDAADMDGDGQVDEDELSAAMNDGGNGGDRGDGGNAGGPTPGDIIMMCDTDASGGLTKDEANTCIDQMITDPQANQDAHDQVNNGFDAADMDGDGQVDEAELSAAMNDGGNGGNDDNRGDGSGPSPGDIISMCDTDASGGLTKAEAHTCIDNMITDPQANQQAHDDVNNKFDAADMDGDGQVDEAELAAAMNDGGNGGDGGGPSPGDIIDMCDTDASGGLTKDEANTCIDQMITDPQANQQAHDDVNNKFDAADMNGDGEVDAGELAAAMNDGGNGGNGGGDHNHLAQRHHHHNLAERHHHHLAERHHHHLAERHHHHLAERHHHH